MNNGRIILWGFAPEASLKVQIGLMSSFSRSLSPPGAGFSIAHESV